MHIHKQCYQRELEQRKIKAKPSKSGTVSNHLKIFEQTIRTGAQRNWEEGIHVENLKIHKVGTSGSQSSHLLPKRSKEDQDFNQAIWEACSLTGKSIIQINCVPRKTNPAKLLRSLQTYLHRQAAAKPNKQQQRAKSSKTIAVLPCRWKLQTAVDSVRCPTCPMCVDHLWPREGSEGLSMNKIQQRTNCNKLWTSKEEVTCADACALNFPRKANPLQTLYYLSIDDHVCSLMPFHL